MSIKYTKQGVRDLDAMLGKHKSKGVKLPSPPKQVEVACAHRNAFESGHDFYFCPDCNHYIPIDAGGVLPGSLFGRR